MGAMLALGMPPIIWTDGQRKAAQVFSKYGFTFCTSIALNGGTPGSSPEANG
jgi:hypothetical protein